MSIELSKVKKEEESNSFNMEVAMPDLRQKSTAIKIDTKNTNMEKTKKKEIKKKKEEKKFFHELLKESWDKGILNRGHTGQMEDGPNTYYCPICCVCELVGILPSIRLEEQKRGRVYHTPTHEEMVEKLKSKVNFIDSYVTVKARHTHRPIPDYFNDGSDFRTSADNEPMVAFSLASALTGYMNNGEIAQDIKEQLYDHKPLEEIKPRMLGRSDIWDTPLELKFHTRSSFPSLSDAKPMDRFIIIRDPFTGRQLKQNVRTGDVIEL